MTRTTHLIVLLLCAQACVEVEEPVPVGPHLLFSADPLSLDNPFPDARLKGAVDRPDAFSPFLPAAAKSAKVEALLKTYAQGVAESGGVGAFGPTLLRTSEPVDPASLAGAASRLVRTPDGWRVIEADVPLEPGRAALSGTGYEEAEGFPEFLVARPRISLAPGQEGFLVLRRGPRTVGGTLLERSPDFMVSDEVRLIASALGLGAEEILLVLPQSAPDSARVFTLLADWTSTAPAPGFEIPAKGLVPEGTGQRLDGAWRAGDPDWDTVTAWLTRHTFGNPPSDVGQVIVGHFDTRDLRDAGRWRTDWIEDPAQAPVVELPFVLTLPAGEKPEGGWRVVIGAHGVSGRNIPRVGNGSTFCLEVAQALASRGLGCLGIDAAEHGTRGGSLTEFFAIDDLRRLRDNFRQTAFDLMQLSRLAQVLDVEGDGTPDLSGELGFFGNSLGAIMGGTFVSYDLRVKYAVLNVPGGGLGDILTGPTMRDRIGLLLVAETDLPFGSAAYYGVFPLMVTLGQGVLEPADPVNLGHAFRQRTGRALLIQEGLRDKTIPNFTTEALAVSMGVEAAETPLSGGEPIRALFRVDPTKYNKPFDFDGHNVFWHIASPRNQVLTFLESGGTTLIVE